MYLVVFIRTPSNLFCRHRNETDAVCENIQLKEVGTNRVISHQGNLNIFIYSPLMKVVPRRLIYSALFRPRELSNENIRIDTVDSGDIINALGLKRKIQTVAWTK